MFYIPKEWIKDPKNTGRIYELAEKSSQCIVLPDEDPEGFEKELERMGETILLKELNGQ